MGRLIMFCRHHQFQLPNCLVYLLPCCGMVIHPNAFVTLLSNLFLKVSRILLYQPTITALHYTSDLQFGFKRGFSTDLCTGLQMLVSSRQKFGVLCQTRAKHLTQQIMVYFLSYFLSETYHVLSHVFCCSGTVVNSYRLGGMVSFLHLFLYQMVYDRMESYPQSCLRIYNCMPHSLLPGKGGADQGIRLN